VLFACAAVLLNCKPASFRNATLTISFVQATAATHLPMISSHHFSLAVYISNSARTTLLLYISLGSSVTFVELAIEYRERATRVLEAACEETEDCHWAAG
jgi:hypothetical protein